VTQTDWNSALTTLTARQIRHYRERLNMSAEHFAAAVELAGLPYTRAQVANLESGRRTTLTIGEVLIFSKVLGVPAMQLLFPADLTELVEVLPGFRVTMREASRFFLDGRLVELMSTAPDAAPPLANEVASEAIEEVRKWPPTVDLTTAAQALGIGRTKAYEMARLGTFPIRLLRMGKRHRVSTADVLAYLGA
jgi:transcriptional regulator with XRE-family HTH domain